MELKLILESLLFSAPKPLSVSELREVLVKAATEGEPAPETAGFRKVPGAEIEGALEVLAAEHAASGRSYRLVCIAGAWQFVTQPEYSPWLRAFVGAKARPTRLSQPALETLAVIAYRQPVTRAEIEQIRGVAVDGVVATLKERGLIEEAGRAEVVGRPMQYATTRAFLEYFGLASLEELPAADELRRIPVQRPEALVTAEAGGTEPVEQMSLELADPEAAGGAAAATPATPAASVGTDEPVVPSATSA
ncbi:MAG: SMC-Scp complex subunit ScpB [Verrucomicrobiae bacterium]|nr:SMC-Scp complex subunit ScpB [Verrucomicrobiae bacterium]